MKGFKVVLAAICIASACGSPTPELKTVKKRPSNLPVIPGDDNKASLNLLKFKKWKLQPVQVKQVEAYEPNSAKAKEGARHPGFQQKRGNGAEVYSKQQVSSSSSSFSNINGNIDAQTNRAGKVEENGELVGSYKQSNHQQGLSGHQLHTQGLTEVDVPRLNLHEKVVENDGQLQHLDTNKRSQGAGVEEEGSEEEDEDSLMVRVAVDLAEYFMKTGDEKGIIEFIEALVNEDKMSEHEGLMYLDLIRSIIENETDLEREAEEEKEREDEAQNILNFSDYLDSSYQSGAINRAVYRDLKDKLMESVIEKAEEDPKFLSIPQGENY